MSSYLSLFITTEEEADNNIIYINVNWCIYQIILVIISFLCGYWCKKNHKVRVIVITTTTTTTTTGERKEQHKTDNKHIHLL